MNDINCKVSNYTYYNIPFNEFLHFISEIYLTLRTNKKKKQTKSYDKHLELKNNKKKKKQTLRFNGKEKLNKFTHKKKRMVKTKPTNNKIYLKTKTKN